MLGCATMLSMDDSKKMMGGFSYLSPAEIEKILKGYEELGIEYQEPYEGASDFTKNLEQVSLYRSDDIVYSADISTTSSNPKAKT